jgi:hypothetical protein
VKFLRATRQSRQIRRTPMNALCPLSSVCVAQPKECVRPVPHQRRDGIDVVPDIRDPDALAGFPAARQPFDRRIATREQLVTEIAAWERQRNATGARIKWMFTTEKARAKMGHAYPETAGATKES